MYLYLFYGIKVVKLLFFIAEKNHPHYVYDLIDPLIKVNGINFILDKLLNSFARLNIRFTQLDFCANPNGLFIAELSPKNVSLAMASEISLSRELKILNGFKKLSSVLFNDRFRLKILFGIKVNNGVKFSSVRHVNYMCDSSFNFLNFI